MIVRSSILPSTIAKLASDLVIEDSLQPLRGEIPSVVGGLIVHIRIMLQSVAKGKQFVYHLIELFFGPNLLISLHASVSGVAGDDLTFIRRPILIGVVVTNLVNELRVIGDVLHYAYSMA
jgi:hypothetical protein